MFSAGDQILHYAPFKESGFPKIQSQVEFYLCDVTEGLAGKLLRLIEITLKDSIRI